MCTERAKVFFFLCERRRRRVQSAMREQLINGRERRRSPTPEVVPPSGMREDQTNDTNDFVI
jgi:hypothetical protein